ncbi:MAG TPA: hypothetical protein EYP56_02965 [Planctomycetaceae bacterium]|nr:hypothetical protein [Planctomycetaceae bacterium]
MTTRSATNVSLSGKAAGWILATVVLATGPNQPVRAGETPSDSPLGHPLAPGIISLVEKEIVGSLQRRGISASFARFRSYAAAKLEATARPSTGSEVNGRCRLSWYDHLLRNPLKAPAEAEAFTRTLHQALAGDHHGLQQAVHMAREKMDVPSCEPRPLPEVNSPEEALEAVAAAVIEAQAGYARALATLTPGQISELSRNLYPVLVGQNRLGHTLQNRSMARRLCDLMQSMDRRGIYDAVEALTVLASPRLHDELRGLTAEENLTVRGVGGRVARRLVTPGGTIILGGPEANTYELDALADVAAVIDLGGDDVYQEGVVNRKRPVLVVIDLGGDDTYRGSQPGIQGSAILGISMLLDTAGNDTYEAKDVAQASALAGAGVLIDYGGDDVYVGMRRVQGQAFGGIGILVDRSGNDRYHGALWTQGMGGPLGFAVLDDLAGQDSYYTGGLYYDDYEETPGYDGWGQGVGGGPRQVANGGIGVILDGGGDDTYQFDYLSHGGGYWLGVGLARDFGGNDQRLGATRKNYHGGRRTERLYQRFGTGFGCHYAIGFCFDDEGDDLYGGTIMGLGHAWDCSLGGLFDLGGNDRYISTGGLTQGSAHQAGLAVLFDYRGDDYYRGTSQGHAPSGISYHSMPQCGGNFSFLIDYGGKDTYGCRARNNRFTRRGTAGGFIIDRPAPEEVNPQEKSDPALAQKSNGSS